MPETCTACSSSIRESELTVACAGYCDAVVHAKCSGLSTPTRRAMEQNPQLLWLCPDCLEFASNGRATRLQAGLLRDLASSLSKWKEELLASIDIRLKTVPPAAPAPPVRRLSLSVPARPEAMRNSPSNRADAAIPAGTSSTTRSAVRALVSTTAPRTRDARPAESLPSSHGAPSAHPIPQPTNRDNLTAVIYLLGPLRRLP